MKIKSLLITAVLATAILCSASAVSAAGLTANQMQMIINLLQSFGVDQATIANVQTSLNGGTPSTPPVTTWCHTFNTNMGVGASGAEVIELQKALSKEGLWLVRQEYSGTFTESLASTVIKFQAKYGILQTGYVGPLTRAKLNSLYGCTTTSNVTITSVSGPNSLAVGQTGTWTVNATAPAGSNLTYRVDWGDRDIMANGMTGEKPAIAVQQTATFTHSYAVAGTYTVKFYVDNGIRCITTPCPSGSAQSSLTVVVGTSTQPSIIINSISGPTSLGVGQTGNWIVNTNAPITSKLKYLIEWGGEGQDGIVGPYTATSNNISISHAYSKAWTYGLIARVWDANTCSPIFNIPTQIIQDSQNCVYSKQITVTVGTSTQPSITVTSPNGGEKWTFGVPQTITWNSTGISNDNVIIYLVLPDSGRCKLADSIPASWGRYTLNIQNNQQCLNIVTKITAGERYKIDIWNSPSSTSVNAINDVSDNYFSISALSVSTPHINSITTPVAVDGMLSIVGTGFTASGNVVHIGTAFQTSASLFDATTIKLSLLNRVSNGTYPVYVTNANGTSNTVYLTVGSAVLPTASISVSPTTITSGQCATLTWRSTNALEASIIGPGPGTASVNEPVSVNGSKSVCPIRNSNYTFSVHGAGGYAQSQTTLTVNPATVQPSITVTSPNGGETYQAGQQITVRWNSYNLNQSVGITLLGQNNTQVFLGSWVANSIGSETITIPTTIQAGNYKINVSTPPGSSPSAQDNSDNYFSITSSTQQSCDDTDGGLIYNVFGSVKDYYDTQYYSDYCTLNGAQVTSCTDKTKNCGIIEKYCASNNRRSSRSLAGTEFWSACPNGCSNGACAQTTQPSYHAADTTKDYKINPAELTAYLNLFKAGDVNVTLTKLLRVISFYNSCGYKVQAGTEDGFTLVACALPYLSADSNKDYKIDSSERAAFETLYTNGYVNLSQYLRMIQFSNSCGYKVQAGTEDGFAPIACASSYHAADTTKDYKINPAELTAYLNLFKAGDVNVTLTKLLRVISFYNSCGYKVQAGTEDGFTLVACALPYLSADSNKDYKIDSSERAAFETLYTNGYVNLSQYLRMIQFSNSCGYKVQAGTEDGFAPIGC